ncbi:hypothetical protein OG897_40225 [Streptomyces sp. NBC_00237]|uniref:hypothetical protein n=1 Tax=Streptomyces sp. NBC_00237 TaxID=2975687 RepID=UPI00224DF668|nr:hypothetical protein [Streptomyces sp. NBC_00237]MCX5207620.1 hypothetical protein [Streptomyces sp. NBC_00237]
MSAPLRRVYGTAHDDPHPGPQDGHAYVELVGGPLDGELLDVTSWTESERETGAYLITEAGAYGPGGRASYGPRPSVPQIWDWEGDGP